MRIGVVVYNRGACRLGPRRPALLAERCPNLVGFKDGLGDIELHGRDPPPPGRPLRVPRRPADRRGLRAGLPGDRRAGVLVRGLQLRPAHRHRVLRRGREGRPRDHRPPARHVLPAVPGDPQPARGLRRQHRQGGGAPRRQGRRPGAPPADSTSSPPRPRSSTPSSARSARSRRSRRAPRAAEHVERSSTCRKSPPSIAGASCVTAKGDPELARISSKLRVISVK